VEGCSFQRPQGGIGFYGWTFLFSPSLLIMTMEPLKTLVGVDVVGLNSLCCGVHMLLLEIKTDFLAFFLNFLLPWVGVGFLIKCFALFSLGFGPFSLRYALSPHNFLTFPTSCTYLSSCVACDLTLPTPCGGGCMRVFR